MSIACSEQNAIFTLTWLGVCGCVCVNQAYFLLSPIQWGGGWGTFSKSEGGMYLDFKCI